MTKKMYLETLKSALCRSIYHYYQTMFQYTEQLPPPPPPLVLQKIQKFLDIETRKNKKFDKTFANYQMNLEN